MHAASDSDILGSAGMAQNNFLFNLSNIHVFLVSLFKCCKIEDQQNWVPDKTA